MKRIIRPSLIIKVILWVVLPLLVLKYPIECTVPVSTTKEGKVTTYRYDDYIHRLPSEFDGKIYKFKDDGRAFDFIKKSIQPENYKREKEAGVEEYFFNNYTDFKRYLIKSYLTDSEGEKIYNSESPMPDYRVYNKDLFSTLEKDFKLGPDETIDDFFKKEFEDGKVVFVASYNSKDYDYELLGVHNYREHLDISVFYKEKSKNTTLYPYMEDRIAKEFVFIKPKYPAVNITINEYHETREYYDKLTGMFLYIIILFFYAVYFFTDLSLTAMRRVSSGREKNKKTEQYYEKLKKSDNIILAVMKEDMKDTLKEFDNALFVKEQTELLNDEDNEEDDDDPIKFL